MKSASIYLGIVAAMAASACLAELQDENILTKLPDGFKIDFQQRNKDVLISEMVPVKQSVKNWTEMVTVQVFYGLKATPESKAGWRPQVRRASRVPSPRGRRTAIRPWCGCRIVR
jgi:hypothetical protein